MQECRDKKSPLDVCDGQSTCHSDIEVLWGLLIYCLHEVLPLCCTPQLTYTGLYTYVRGAKSRNTGNTLVQQCHSVCGESGLYTYVRTYICMYVCTYIRTYTRTYVCMYVYVSTPGKYYPWILINSPCFTGTHKNKVMPNKQDGSNHTSWVASMCICISNTANRLHS